MMYFVTPTHELPFTDFNREMIHPGDHPELPYGCVGVRVDDDFWLVAVLPYKEYKDKSIQEIVAELWPDAKDPTFNPDSGDPAWEERLKVYRYD